MFIATVTEQNGVTFYLSRNGWNSDRHHSEVLTFDTKRDAYRAYLRACKPPADVYQAVPAEKVWAL